jgi:hypothetical protein
MLRPCIMVPWRLSPLFAPERTLNLERVFWPKKVKVVAPAIVLDVVIACLPDVSHSVPPIGRKRIWHFQLDSIV